jgi:hypothetical protein
LTLTIAAEIIPAINQQRKRSFLNSRTWGNFLGGVFGCVVESLEIIGDGLPDRFEFLDCFDGWIY